MILIGLGQTQNRDKEYLVDSSTQGSHLVAPIYFTLVAFNVNNRASFRPTSAESGAVNE